jgi:acetolactate synthase-1/3 small subunit
LVAFLFSGPDFLARIVDRKPPGGSSMERMFLITASNRARVESRILQVLDHHMVPVESFSSMRLGEEARVTFMAELDDDGARRTCDMLRRLHDVQSIDCFARQDGFCRTLAMFRILCDQESRLPLLQVISSMGAQVVAVRPDWVAFQIIGSLQDIEGLRASLLPYGLVEAISAASTAVRNHASQKTDHEVESPATGTSKIRSISAGYSSEAVYQISV